MEFKTQNHSNGNGNGGPPNNPEKEIPAKPDKNPDPTKPRPGGNEPERNDPTRIQEPTKIDPTRIDQTPPKSRAHKWTRVNNWDEVFEKMSLQKTMEQ